ncbi:serine/threonine-protein kinase [Streptomyces althioticus]|uniref:serine/threonine-protein kinase n=1 Tax=Actinomycetes TaxID=1760 RepID=UPI00073ACE80|nr:MULTISPECIES: serine/threonine-protein kinase [Actinomycetes]ALV51787.1 serine/threonine protein kinase [Streptomyces sp. 4F]MBM4829065.1 serine/threonine protein kinase [Actinospica acidiphila]WTC23533.1 protein kinase [Streptomyces althioticus]
MVTEGEPDNGTDGANTRVVAGRYRLEGLLGRGGMGVVWRATDQLLGRGVAVKELPFDDTLTAADARRQRERTLREARALAQLSHPNIIVVHDVVEDDERPYIVLELIDGPSLADRLASDGPVDAAEAARIGVCLLGALRAAHESGVLHRDLKPANVLLEDGTERVLLTDFGIAQMPGSTTLTESGSFVGSPEYTAPERMSGARTGPESDLWSLGALLCAALSGESPFRRDSLSGVLHAVVVDEIRPPAQAAPILPVVLGLLERDPDRRLDADRAERMLRVFLATGRTPETAPLDLLPDRDPPRRRLWREVPEPAPPGAPAGRGVRRQPTRGALVAALVIAALAGAGVSAGALLLQDRGGEGGGGTPSTTAPETPAPGSTPGPLPPATTPQRPAPSPTGAGASSTGAGGSSTGSGASSTEADDPATPPEETTPPSPATSSPASAA